MTRRIMILCCALLMGGCTPVDPDVKYFVDHSGGGRAWLAQLPEQRQVDMFFASHRTRPDSFLVDLWIIESQPALLPVIRVQLDARGADPDVDAFLRIVEASGKRGSIDSAAVTELNLKPLCERTKSTRALCVAVRNPVASTPAPGCAIALENRRR